MSDFAEIKPVSEDTNAILLLCASLGKCQKDTPSPLTVSEYAELVDSLRTLNLRPGRLLYADTMLLDSLIENLSEKTRRKITTQRLDSLLGRGGLLALSLSRWTSAGIWVVSRADEAYPLRYKRKLGRLAPPIVYGVGPGNLMHRGGLAVVGSRKPDSASETYTHHVGQWAASSGVQIVSGAASGVDEISMMSCVENGGTAIGVVADSLLRTSTRTGFRMGILQERILLLSSFDPDAGFSVGNAMGRNRWVYALADQALVVACSEGRGGTWAGAIEALKHGVRVYVKIGNPARTGNDALMKHGAIPVPEDLRHILDELPSNENIIPADPSMQPIYSLVAPILLQLLHKPMTVQSLSDALGLVNLQTNMWLEQLVKEGKVEMKQKTYQIIRDKEDQLPLFNISPVSDS